MILFILPQTLLSPDYINLFSTGYIQLLAALPTAIISPTFRQFFQITIYHLAENSLQWYNISVLSTEDKTLSTILIKNVDKSPFTAGICHKSGLISCAYQILWRKNELHA